MRSPDASGRPRCSCAGRLPWAVVLTVLRMVSCETAWAQREVKFPPAQAAPPPPVKSPPRTQASGEETSILPEFGPTMRKTQERQPPPPTNLTVMYKIQYGEKLKYVHADGTEQVFDQWQSFQNDGAQIIKATNQRLADGNNYQYATKALASSGFDPVDIPLLYMTGDYDFVLSDSEVENLRRFLLDGGTIVFNAARGRDEFSFAVTREMMRVFPQKSFMKLPLDHPIYNAKYRLKTVSVMVNGVRFTQPPEVYSLDIGTRAAAILIPGGLGTAWSGEAAYHPAGTHIVGESAVRLGVNIIGYVLGGTEYGRFLAQQFPRYDGATRAGDVVKFALVRYAGSWDVNPAIQNSLLQGLKDNTDIDVDYEPRIVDLDSPELANYPLIFMTGHYDFQLRPREIENLRAYLTRGGMLVASSAAGLRPFEEAFRREMKHVFPEADLVKLPPTHALFAHGWNPIDGVEYTPPALRDDPTLRDLVFYGLIIDHRVAAIFSPYDIQGGVNREANAYAKGLAPDDALRVCINIITYALSH